MIYEIFKEISKLSKLFGGKSEQNYSKHIKNKIFTHAVPVVVENLSEHLRISVEHVRLANRVIEQLFFWTS